MAISKPERKSKMEKVKRMEKKKGLSISLTTQILIATVGGIIFGSIVGPWAANLKFIGDIFIRLIQMSVVLLVMSAVAAAVGSGDSQDVGKMGFHTFKWIIFFTVISAGLGVLLAMLIPVSYTHLDVYKRQGIRFYLIPDFGKMLDQGIGNVIFGALSQAFFTLSIGIGALLIFGSYMDKERSLTGEAVSITALDTFVALKMCIRYRCRIEGFCHHDEGKGR